MPVDLISTLRASGVNLVSVNAEPRGTGLIMGRITLCQRHDSEKMQRKAAEMFSKEFRGLAEHELLTRAVTPMSI